MRKLKLQLQLSADGYMADRHEKTDWMVWDWGTAWTWDDELRKEFIDLHKDVDTVLLSRKMAVEGYISHWATVASDGKNPQAVFAKKIRAAHKIVFTNTLTESRWENTSLASGDLLTEIHQLKNQPGKDMIAYGGVSFASSLIQENLVDEFYLYVNPVFLGKGLTPFLEFSKRKNLILTHTKSYACGIAVLRYLSKIEI